MLQPHRPPIYAVARGLRGVRRRHPKPRPWPSSPGVRGAAPPQTGGPRTCDGTPARRRGGRARGLQRHPAGPTTVVDW